MDFIGLVDVLEKENKTNDSQPQCQSIFYDHKFVADYENVASRLITTVDINDSDDDTRVYRANKAIWDTGSMTSCISADLAKKMHLHHESVGVGVTASGQIEVFYYRVNVRISNDIVIPDVRVAGFPLKNHDVDFLIGMDIISQGNLSIKNIDGKTKVEYEYLKKGVSKMAITANTPTGVVNYDEPYTKINIKVEVDTSELDTAIEKMERLVVLRNEYEASTITTELNIDGKVIAKGVKKCMGDNL